MPISAPTPSSSPKCPKHGTPKRLRPPRHGLNDEWDCLECGAESARHRRQVRLLESPDKTLADAAKDRHAADRLTRAVREAMQKPEHAGEIGKRLPAIMDAAARFAVVAEERFARAADRHKEDLARLDSPKIKRELTKLALAEARRRPAQVLASIAADRPDEVLRMADEIRRRRA